MVEELWNIFAQSEDFAPMPGEILYTEAKLLRESTRKFSKFLGWCNNLLLWPRNWISFGFISLEIWTLILISSNNIESILVVFFKSYVETIEPSVVQSKTIKSTSEKKWDNWTTVAIEYVSVSDWVFSI